MTIAEFVQELRDCGESFELVKVVPLVYRHEIPHYQIRSNKSQCPISCLATKKCGKYFLNGEAVEAGEILGISRENISIIIMTSDHNQDSTHFSKNLRDQLVELVNSRLKGD